VWHFRLSSKGIVPGVYRRETWSPYDLPSGANRWAQVTWQWQPVGGKPTAGDSSGRRRLLLSDLT